MQGLPDIGLGNKLIDEAKTTQCKSKNRQARLYQTKIFCSTKEMYRIGENICKPYTRKWLISKIYEKLL